MSSRVGQYILEEFCSCSEGEHEGSWLEPPLKKMSNQRRGKHTNPEQINLFSALEVLSCSVELVISLISSITTSF